MFIVKNRIANDVQNMASLLEGYNIDIDNTTPTQDTARLPISGKGKLIIILYRYLKA